MGDLGHGQTADHPQGQRNPRLHGESGVTAGEDEAEPVVVDGAERLGRVGQQHQRLLVLVRAPGLAPETVDGLAVGGGGQPGAGVGRYAVDRPALDGGRERVCGHLLGDVEITEAPGEGRNHPGPFLAVGPGDRRTDIDLAHRNGRTSTFRYCAIAIISCRRVAAAPAGSHPCYERRRLDPTRSAEIASRISTRMTSYSASDRYPH